MGWIREAPEEKEMARPLFVGLRNRRCVHWQFGIHIVACFCFVSLISMQVNKILKLILRMSTIN
jgi:hypothetical protein